MRARWLFIFILISACSHHGASTIDGAPPTIDAAHLDAAAPDAGGAARGYAASVAPGDLAVWSLSGDTFAIEWTVTDGMGGAAAIYDVSGACTAPDASYAYRDCTIASVTLSSGAPSGGAPQVGDEYYVLELPGVAIVAHPKGPLGDLRHELHVGFALGDCANPGGTFDYDFVRAGKPGNIDELLGRYRVTLDPSGAITAVDDWDYGLVVDGASSTDQASDPVRIALMTPAALPHPIAVSGATCDHGVLRATILGATIRGAITASGAVLVDLPHRPGEVNGSGGLVGSLATNAATLGDLAGKHFSMVLYDETTPVELVDVMVASDGHVTVVSSLKGTIPAGTALGVLTPLDDPSLATFAGALVDDTDLTGGTLGTDATFGAPSGSRASAPLPSSLGGVFVTTDGAGHFADPHGRATIVVTHKTAGGEILIAGSHFGANNAVGGMSRCFSGTPRAGDLQQYCIDGEFVGVSR
jgi:hypothetical protein